MPVNDTTTNRSYQKPNSANNLSYDVDRLRAALDSIDTDVASLQTTTAKTPGIAAAFAIVFG